MGTIQLELSAIVLALRAFNNYIYGYKVIVHSDHRPLIYLMTRKGTHLNLARWAVELMQYDLYIEHVAGTINRVADCLSRIADELPENQVKDLPDAEDIIDFPISLYFAEQAKRQNSCFMLSTEKYRFQVGKKLLQEMPTCSYRGQGSSESDVMIPDDWEDSLSDEAMEVENTGLISQTPNLNSTQ